MLSLPQVGQGASGASVLASQAAAAGGAGKPGTAYGYHGKAKRARRHFKGAPSSKHRYDDRAICAELFKLLDGATPGAVCGYVHHGTHRRLFGAHAAKTVTFACKGPKKAAVGANIFDGWSAFDMSPVTD